MARKRTELGHDVEARIAAGIRRGETAEQVAAALGGVVSGRTIGRRMRELRGPVTAGRSVAATTSASAASAPPASPLPPSPEEIPEGATLTQLDGWISQAEAAIDKAELDENLPLLGQMLRVAASLAETRRKATPPAKADPNDSPDMVKLAAEVAKRLHLFVEILTRGEAA